MKKSMNSKERLSQRFDDMGRFMAADICALPGILENISREGCKICYQFAVSVDMDTDYEAKITFARAASEGSPPLHSAQALPPCTRPMGVAP